jgi:hypothetical protein
LGDKRNPDSRGPVFARSVFSAGFPLVKRRGWPESETLVLLPSAAAEVIFCCPIFFRAGELFTVVA